MLEKNSPTIAFNIFFKKWIEVVYNMGVLGNSPPGIVLGLEVLGHFEFKNSDKIHKEIIKSSCIIFCVKMSCFSQYILIIKKIQTFWDKCLKSRKENKLYDS